MLPEVAVRFIRYARIDTQSDPHSTTCPSTAKQLDLARMLVQELEALGVQEVTLDENGYVMATLPANVSHPAPTVGLIAHMDTSPDLTGANVNPQVHLYQGGDLVLDPENGVVLSPREFPELAQYVGQVLITTDGRTLLGADDKAGIAEIMTALAYLVAHPEIPHGRIRVAFTPDEEIGRGADRFDVARFGADFAYTVDGGELGELSFETFNAARAEVTVRGRSVHPGSAKNKMINANEVAMQFHALLPPAERPEYTADYEGFYHLMAFQGSVEETHLHYIIRDHDRGRFEARKAWLQRAAEFLNARYEQPLVQVQVHDQYYNLREKIEPVMQIVDLAKAAMLACGVTPKVVPVRGGTDGARLSYMGLPTPNLFTGGHNYHGRYEYIPIPSMEKAVAVLVELVRRVTQLPV
ncbi:peptidase T [uncultured Thermanaerothrix sp.]|uniref:peptidase T n=1 Tax=uncultured Thermanaerothrix sp. TaxID=1195149 RepID=UPI00344CA3A1